MGAEDFIGWSEEGDSCIVCLKPVKRGTGFAHIRHEGRMVTLCCPLCMETFQKDSRPYVVRLKGLELEKALRKKTPS